MKCQCELEKKTYCGGKVSVREIVVQTENS